MYAYTGWATISASNSILLVSFISSRLLPHRVIANHFLCELPHHCTCTPVALCALSRLFSSSWVSRLLQSAMYCLFQILLTDTCWLLLPICSYAQTTAALYHWFCSTLYITLQALNNSSVKTENLLPNSKEVRFYVRLFTITFTTDIVHNEWQMIW